MLVKGILVLNAGSSSIKFQLFSSGSDLQVIAGGKIYNLGGNPGFTGRYQRIGVNGEQVDKQILPADYTFENALRFILSWIDKQCDNCQIGVATHRIVHGGDEFTSCVKITPDVILSLQKLGPLAPLHQLQSLALIEIVRSIRPELMQLACFDTSFHANHEPLFTDYALPLKIRNKGIRRYGFHGLSYEWIVHFLKLNEPKLASGRIIAAHLGNGSSLCAIQGGTSIDTTMGLTALDGLVMGTRCGTLDPGAIIYMIRTLGLPIDEVEDILYNQSGLLGLSELTNDVCILQESNAPTARFSLDYFCLRAAQFIAMMAVALGGIDGIVFTGGIGQNSAFVRDNILSRLEFLKPFETRVIAANEEMMMAMHTLRFLRHL